MFDIGFSELTLLFLIALIVLGPERLPRVARTMGLWTGRARAYVRNFTSELERQAQADELRERIQDTKSILNETRQEIQDGITDDSGKTSGQD